MTKQVDLGLFFGESFYELSLVESQSGVPIKQCRAFTSKEPLNSKIVDFLSDLGESKLNNVYVGYRYLERIFSYKLGGSVAQIVPKGLEKWTQVYHQNREESLFKILSAPDLSSSEMVFGVDFPMTPESQDTLITQLKKKEAKRICINLTLSPELISDYENLKSSLKENGFEVFDGGQNSSVLNFNTARSHLIEASLTGTFNELKSEIQTALGDRVDPAQIHFSYKYQDSGLNRPTLLGLFSIENAFFDCERPPVKTKSPFQVVHLGLENFSVWSDNIIQWNSLWGPTDIFVPDRVDLKIQPTNSFYLNSFDEIEITKSEETFEPGPMLLGRGKTPCVYDILNFESASPETLKRLKDSFWALARSAKTDHTSENIFDEFRVLIGKRILLEARSLITAPNVVFYGDWSDQFTELARLIFKSKNLTFISQEKLNKATLMTLGGRKWQ